MSDDRAADLVDRLREAGWQKHANNDDVLMLEAADEVERLRVALAEATAECVIECDADCDAVCHMGHVVKWRRSTSELVAVRAALQGLMVQAAIVYDAYDNEERGAAMWQEMIALEAARAVAAGVLNREGWCETCQMTVAANHAHDDTCGHCSGGPVVNSDCPIHGAAGVLTKDSDT